ncbi:hypothetical protein CAPTEDRAFT_191435 [Capitella teleta]|uniref:Uncharacterized protein n=1 Tax=Capitella teleta TaxID=283909 RepID=R7VAY0_CAPTE|nr:hypothetical protein CAPTEDRAFT_191435 [Capitella teleta]|eukprot:ELU15759.1 hypothetical protein CAPTEDRAFT_191435 [Capitella teleta]
MALAVTIDNITKSLDSKKHVISLFLDLKKAFDTIDFNILLKILNYYGICGNVLTLLKNYLSNRNQTVKNQTPEVFDGKVRYDITRSHPGSCTRATLLTLRLRFINHRDSGRSTQVWETSGYDQKAGSCNPVETPPRPFPCPSTGLQAISSYLTDPE